MSHVIYLNNARQPNLDDVIEELLHFRAQKLRRIWNKEWSLIQFHAHLPKRPVNKASGWQDGWGTWEHPTCSHHSRSQLCCKLVRLTWWRTDYRNREMRKLISKLTKKIIVLVFWPQKEPWELFLRPCQGSQMLQGLAHVLQLWWRVLSHYLWTLAQYGSHPLRKMWPPKKRKSESLIVFLTLLVPSGLHAYFASNGPGNWVTWSKKISRT